MKHIVICLHSPSDSQTLKWIAEPKPRPRFSAAQVKKEATREVTNEQSFFPGWKLMSLTSLGHAEAPYNPHHN